MRYHTEQEAECTQNNNLKNAQMAALELQIQSARWNSGGAAEIKIERVSVTKQMRLLERQK